jgi:hypothetical protein
MNSAARALTAEKAGHPDATEFEEAPVFHPSVFAGVTVLVSLRNHQQRQFVEHTLLGYGATVLESELQTVLPEVIVADHKAEAVIPIPLSLLAKLPGGKLPSPGPRVIVPNQIPWVKRTDGAMIVVADSLAKYRPNFLAILKMPTLHFNRVYCGSPFIQPPIDFEARLKNRDGSLSPTTALIQSPCDNGFCELCSLPYQNANAHRNSSEHLRRAANLEIFADLDNLIRSFHPLL